MKTEQIDELISVIARLGEGNFSWSNFFANITVSIISAAIAALVAYGVAKLQIDKSEEQQRTQREEELKNQKRFMMEELKLKTTEKLLESRPNVNSSIVKMMDISRDKYKHFLNNRINYSAHINEASEADFLIRQHFDVFQIYLSNLSTFINLFNIEKNVIDIEELNRTGNEFYDSCTATIKYTTYNHEEDGVDFELDLYPKSVLIVASIKDYDSIIREKQIGLIRSMQQ